MKAEQKTVLITGCSSGLGRFTSDYLSKKGFRVIATVRKESDAVNLRKAGLECLLLDLNSSASIKENAEKVLEITNGVLFGLINNSGIELLGAVEDLSRDDLRLCFETNLFGTIELTNSFIPVFRKQHGGKIIFISASNSNGFGYPFLGPGNATKSALETIASALKRELRYTGISVSTVCPDELCTSLLPNMLRYSQHIITGNKSVHSRSYSLLHQKFSHPHTAKNANYKFEIIARSIVKILHSNNPPRRIVAPFSARLHYLAHAILPEWLQDILLFHKMKRGSGVEL
ncbi:MAG: SDR family NAD(P)-dependent oxidoreductase [Fibrobacter sp.]|jgi:NAD(P)-dependent dehydrogenase (short-subunit alcohol dehydrogenase family)|nr:SDR family NAD(P)-dependent oxidoreductase [Fibrobacter sp.]